MSDPVNELFADKGWLAFAGGGLTLLGYALRGRNRRVIRRDGYNAEAATLEAQEKAKQKDAERHVFDETITALREEIKVLRGDVGTNRSELVEVLKQLADARVDIATMKAEIRHKDETIGQLRQHVAQLEAVLATRDAELTCNIAERKDLRAEIDDLKARIRRLIAEARKEQSEDDATPIDPNPLIG